MNSLVIGERVIEAIKKIAETMGANVEESGNVLADCLEAIADKMSEGSNNNGGGGTAA